MKTTIKNKSRGFGLIKIMIILVFLIFSFSDWRPSVVQASQPPSVTTQGVTNITIGSALLQGHFSPNGRYTIVWFEWGTTSDLGNITVRTGDLATRTFEKTISGLLPNTTYYFRAVAENIDGRRHGRIITFRTDLVDRPQGVALSDLSVRKLARSIDRNTNWQETITAAPGELISFWIEVRADRFIQNVTVRNVLPKGIAYLGVPKVDNVIVNGGIREGIRIREIEAGQRRIIIFNAEVNQAESFLAGGTNLISSVFVSAGGETVNDTAQISVIRGVVAGVATEVRTGLTDNKLIDFILLPLFFTTLLFLFFRRHFWGITEWMESQKELANQRRANRKLKKMRDWVIDKG